MSSNKGTIYYRLSNAHKTVALVFKERDLDSAQLALWKHISYRSGMSGNNRAHKLLKPEIRDDSNGRKFVALPTYIADEPLEIDEAMRLIEQAFNQLRGFNQAVKEHNALNDEVAELERQRLKQEARVAELESMNQDKPLGEPLTRAATLAENEGRYTFMLEYVAADEPTTNYTKYISDVHELPFGSMLYQNYLRGDFYRFEFVYDTYKFVVTRHDWQPQTDKPLEWIDFLKAEEADEIHWGKLIDTAQVELDLGESDDEPLDLEQVQERFETTWQWRAERLEPFDLPYVPDGNAVNE